MHVRTLLQNTFEKASTMHAKRREVFLLASETLLKSDHLTVAGLGRGIRNHCKTKHNINRMNRLVGNEHLYKESQEIYGIAVQLVIGNKKRPVILVDWSSITPGGKEQLLRASVALQGRSIPIYEEIHKEENYSSSKVHKNFLKKLDAILPKDCKPIIVTDAGFGVPWFKEVLSKKWDFVGRLRSNSCYKDKKSQWQKIPDLLEYNRSQTKSLGLVGLTKGHEFNCYLQVYKGKKKNRHRTNVYGKRAQRKVNLESAKRAKEPWIIASSFGKTHTESKQVMKLYSLRMQIEESFRDLKSKQFGFGLRDSRTKGKMRLTNLILIAAIATIMAWLIGLSGRRKGLQYAFQANTTKNTNQLSVIFLAREIIKHGGYLFTKGDITTACQDLSDLCQEAGL